MSGDIFHYGTPRHSGRYPWGSGENPYQRNKSFIAYIDELKRQGLTEKEIADQLGYSMAQLRAKKTIALSETKKEDQLRIIKLKEKGYSNVAIAKELGLSEGTVRNYLKDREQQKFSKTELTANMLKDSLAETGYIDIGSGVERYLGVSRTQLMASIEMLKEEGYKVQYISVPIGNGNKVSIMTLTKPEITYQELYLNRDKIEVPNHYSTDGGDTWEKIRNPEAVSSDRIHIRYGDEGGSDKDGVIELRRGVDDLSLGSSQYAQVRISVDGTHYLKGMAVYSDNMPDGVDIIFNTNKASGTPPEDVFKKMKDDPTNPFGSTISRQSGALNIVREEGEWSEWANKLSSQFLSKQSPALAKKQLDLAFDLRKEELDDILTCTNPLVKKKLLEEYAGACDSDAVHLKAAGLPRQSNHVILPLKSIKESEIYAPNFRDGEKVVLIRHPHGGIFEIPELTVNNKNKEAQGFMKNAKDAVGIHPKVAEQLSGADFDGDTVLVIPNNNRSVKTKASLESLKNFDPKIYQNKSLPEMKDKTKQTEMGKVSNLITDMTIKGASYDEISRAVKHSMVVIDAQKHSLDYKQSFIDNGIAALKKKYQGGENKGASTLISKASSEIRVPEQKEYKYPSKMTESELARWNSGQVVYRETGRTYTTTNKQTGVTKTTQALSKTTRMANTSNAFELSSGTRIESVYAEYANKMKALANEARKEARSTKTTTYSSEAAKKYAEEVSSLKSKLNVAEKNAPLERKARAIADTKVSAVKKSNPGMDEDDLKKLKRRALAEARASTGASKQTIKPTEKEWSAIQAGAISNNTLEKILNNADSDTIKSLAMPRTSKGLSDARLARAKSMLANGYTQAQVADSLGISVSALNKAL